MSGAVSNVHIYYPAGQTAACYDLRKVVSWVIVGATGQTPPPGAFGAAPFAQVRFQAQDAVVWFNQADFETAKTASLAGGG